MVTATPCCVRDMRLTAGITAQHECLALFNLLRTTTAPKYWGRKPLKINTGMSYLLHSEKGTTTHSSGTHLIYYYKLPLEGVVGLKFPGGGSKDEKQAQNSCQNCREKQIATAQIAHRTNSPASNTDQPIRVYGLFCNRILFVPLK